VDRDVEWLGTGAAPALPRPAPPADAPPVLRMEGVTLGYGGVPAVRDVTLTLGRGRTLGLVGQSGSGKTTLTRAVLGLLPPAAGRVELFGQDIAAGDRTARRDRQRRVQMVFQDPFTSLDPMMSVARIVAEPLVVNGIGTARSRRARAAELLTQVDLPESYLARLPAQLSGGQRQRVAIARALALEPELVICDEPVSALDVSVQATVLNLLKRLSRELHLTMLFVSHDLAVVRFVADDVAVIHAGEIVETGETAAVLDRPRHPYTRGLIAASRLELRTDRREGETIETKITGAPP
jgi:ABC-type glutathione transport system ATPase component